MCDTVVVVGADGVLVGKNSDRDANEAQLLEWHPRRTWPAGARVRCTTIELPQVAETAAVLLSRPSWGWGAEMGANEHGVVIGNEAVFTNVRVERDGLTGMDLVRLALERSQSAEDAVQVLVSLVEAHPQGGRMGFEDPSFRYHSSFLVADPRGAWVVETAGHAHAEERVTSGVRTISNALGIDAFARRYSDRLKTAVAAGRVRRARTAASLAGATSAADVMRALGDHGGSGGPSYRFVNGTLGVPCMHGGGVVAASVTTASWVSALRPDRASHWATASSAPDLALFKPVHVGDPVDLGPAEARFWRFERLHRRWLRNPEALGPQFLPERDAVQARWLADPPPSAAAFAEEDARLEQWIAAVEAPPEVPDVRPWFARRWWARRERAAWPLGS